MAAPFQIPRGVTGFGAGPSADVKQYRQFLDDRRRRCGYRVLEAPPDRPLGAHSYVRATVQFHGHSTILLLLNIYGPFLGFAMQADENTLLHEFVDHADLATEFKCYNPIGAAVLNAAPTEATVSLLSRAERKQLNYWKPARIGDILFNWWD